MFVAQSRETAPVSPSPSAIYLVHGMFYRHLRNAWSTVSPACRCSVLRPLPITIACIQSTLTGLSLSSYINDLAALAALFSSLQLQLNLTKLEFIWFGSRASLAKIPSGIRSPPICRTAIDSADVVLDIGIWLDSELTMK